METKDNVIEDFKKKLKHSIGNSPDPTRVGRVGDKPEFNFAVKPDNYRRYYDFDKRNFNVKTLLSEVEKQGWEGFSYEIKNYNSEHHLLNFWGCRVIVRKKSVEVINHWQGGKWKVISADTIQEFDERLDSYIEDLIKRSDEALSKLIEFGGGVSNRMLLRARGEIGIHGDEFLDSVPDSLIIHDTYAKKLYNKKTEIFTDKQGKAGYVKNYITNRAIEKISPDIANELSAVREMAKLSIEMNQSTSQLINVQANQGMKYQKDLMEFRRDVRVHNKVLKGIEKAFNKFNTKLDQKKLGEYM